MMKSRSMRVSLMMALLASASVVAVDAARAQATNTDTISTVVTTAVGTSTAYQGGNGNVVISSTGGITISSGTAALVEDSAAYVTNQGAITVDNASNISGILVTDSSGGTVTNSGTISVTDSTPATTLPLTAGTARYGILVEGSGPLNGSVVSNAGSISVLGNNSAAISIRSGLTGGIDLSVGTSVTGNDSYALETLGTISGAYATSGSIGISITGSTTAFGQASTAVYIGAPVTGELYIDGTVQSNAYYSGAQDTSRPTTMPTTLTAKNEAQAGPAVIIGGSIGGGIELDDAATLTTLGSAPALLIGSASGGSTVISPGSSGYGLLINTSATIIGNGIYDGVSATAVQIGGAGGGASGTTVNGGGATIGGNGIENLGKIQAIAYGESATTTTTATAISVRGGATALSLLNAGTIEADVHFGYNGVTAGNATAISDTAGSLNQITNTGTIEAISAKGNTVALDLSANNVTVTQAQASNSTIAPYIIGDIDFGATSSAALNLDAGTINGAINYGSGANTLTINNGSQLISAITQASGGALNLDVASGRLVNTSLDALTASALTIGKSGEIDLAINPATDQVGGITVVGATLIAAGAKIGLDFESRLTSPETFTLIDSTSPAMFTAPSSILLGDVPYFYIADLSTNPSAGVVSVSLSDRPFADAGVPGNAAAYNAIFNVFGRDPGIFDTFNSAATPQSFKTVFQQELPSYSGGLFEMLSEGAGALVQAQANNPNVERGDRTGGWAQQIGFGSTQNSSEAPGFYGGGLGFAFGWETPATPISTIGYSVSYMRGSVTDENAGPNNREVGTLYTAGVYWRETDGNFHANASLNAGVAELNSVRNFSGAYFDGSSFTRNATSQWTGGMGQVHLAVDYEQDLGDDFYVKPNIASDYFVLYEGSHSDHNGGAGLDLSYASSVGKQGSATGGLTVGARIGEGFIWKPELTVGYKEVFGGPDDTVANFSGGSSFSLSAPSQKSGPVAKIGIHGGDKYTDIAFEAGGEDRGDYKAVSGQLVARFNF